MLVRSKWNVSGTNSEFDMALDRKKNAAILAFILQKNWVYRTLHEGEGPPNASGPMQVKKEKCNHNFAFTPDPSALASVFSNTSPLGSPSPKKITSTVRSSLAFC